MAGGSDVFVHVHEVEAAGMKTLVELLAEAAIGPHLRRELER